MEQYDTSATSEAWPKKIMTIAELGEKNEVTDEEFIATLEHYVKIGAAVGEYVTDIMQRIVFSKEDAKKVMELALDGHRNQAGRGHERSASEYLTIVGYINTVK